MAHQNVFRTREGGGAKPLVTLSPQTTHPTMSDDVGCGDVALSHFHPYNTRIILEITRERKKGAAGQKTLISTSFYSAQTRLPGKHVSYYCRIE